MLESSQRLLGHTDPSLVLRLYAHASDEAVRRVRELRRRASAYLHRVEAGETIKITSITGNSPPANGSPLELNRFMDFGVYGLSPDQNAAGSI